MNELLYHHGILGQRWGIRRFQNKDGTLTDAGRKRYDVDIESAKKRVNKAREKRKQAADEYNKKSNYGMVYKPKEAMKLQKATGNENGQNVNFNQKKLKRN